MSKMGVIARSGIGLKPNETMRLIVTIFLGVVFGFLIGISFSTISLASSNSINDLVLFGQLKSPSIDMGYGDDSNSDFSIQAKLLNAWASIIGHNTTRTTTTDSQILNDTSKIWVPTNPRGAEMLPPGIVASESDFYLRRLWGKPSEDFTFRPKYLVTFTVGYSMKQNVDEAVKKFSDDFTIMLFHYDGLTTEWDEFEWSKRAIHVSVNKQTKWWYAKRFLHPDIVAAYDYIFIWDEDLGVENFNAEEYIRLVRKHKLEISQPGLEPNKKLVWQMTKRRDGLEVHKQTEEKPGWCRNPHLPPCAAFVEIMAPVFSRDAWRCVWNMIQNDLVHGWGLDFAMRRCVEPGHERIGVVDAQWIVHQSVPSLGSQGESENGEAPWKGVRERCKKEWWMFRVRMENAEKKYYRDLEIKENAEKKYYRDLEINPPNSTAH